MKFGGQIRNIDVNFRSDRPLGRDLALMTSSSHVDIRYGRALDP